MPRSTNSQAIQNSLKKKIESISKKCQINKKEGCVEKQFGDGRTKKCFKSTSKLFKFGSQNMLGCPLFPNEDTLLISNIFNKTQKRYCCLMPGEGKWWEDGPRVAIVGAGIAGLSAATHLANHGFTNFHIFEANHRLGGRINTAIFSKGGTCELGGEWLSGGDLTNGLVMLANQEGQGTDTDWRYNRHIVCLTSEGKALTSELCSIGRQIFNKVRKECHRLYRVASDFKHGTISYFLDKRISEETRCLSDGCMESLARLMLALKNDLRVKWGADLSEMSSDSLGSFAEEPGDAIRLNCGLARILLPLVRKIPQTKIHLSAPVNTVFWGRERTSIVLAGNQEIPVDYIIITVPLGFLKKNVDSFFHPKLPKSKKEAIEKMGYGNVTKICMKYRNEMWGKRRTEISTLWKTRDWCDRSTYWYKGISSIHVQGSMASVTVGGPESIFVEQESSDVVAHDLTALLRCFTGAAFIPVPQELLKSRWNTDSWNFGSGSFMSLDTRPCDPPNLAKPVSLCGEDKPKLLFAGEATCVDNLNSIQGARKSGIREAERLLSIVCDPELNKEEEEE